MAAPEEGRAPRYRQGPGPKGPATLVDSEDHALTQLQATHGGCAWSRRGGAEGGPEPMDIARRAIQFRHAA